MEEKVVRNIYIYIFITTIYIYIYMPVCILYGLKKEKKKTPG